MNQIELNNKRLLANNLLLTKKLNKKESMEILKSASKIAFLTLIITASLGFLFGKLPVDQFMLLATGASAFYFSNKGEQGKEYLGK